MKWIFALLLIGIGFSVRADQVYMTPTEFLNQTFGETVPAASVLWLNKAHQEKAETLLGHRAPGLRVRYWQQGDRVAWIFDETGKEYPITMGFVISEQTIESVAILIYRETRGGEVRHSYFTGQFVGAKLNESERLSKTIDGISGATLSVNAVEAVARWALYLQTQIQ